MDTKDVIDYLNKTYGTKVGKCPESLFIFTDQKKSVNKDFMKYLRQCLNVEYKLDKDATYAEVKPFLDQLCKVLYNGYTSSVVTLLRIGMFAKGVVNSVDLDNTYDWDFGGYLSHTQDLLGIGSTNGFWAAETYALFNDTQLVYDEENGDRDVLSMAHSLNSYLANHQDALDKYNLQFVRTDGILDNFEDYVPIITARLYNNLGLSCGFITNPKQEKPELPELVTDNSDNWQNAVTQLLFIRGCSANPDYNNWDDLDDDLGYFDDAYYQVAEHQDRNTHVSKETVTFLLSNKQLPNAVSVLKFKTEFEKEMRKKLNNNSFNLTYNEDDDIYHSVLKELIGNTDLSILLSKGASVSFNLYNGKNAKEKYGKHDDPVKGTFDQYASDIKNGSMYKDTEQFGKRFQLKYTSVIPSFTEFEKTITDPQLKLTTGLHLTDGKVKTQMSASALGKDLSITWLIYITKMHNKDVSMPYLLKIKISFTNEDMLGDAYTAMQLLKESKSELSNDVVSDAIKSIKDSIDQFNSSMAPWIEGTAITITLAALCIIAWPYISSFIAGFILTLETIVTTAMQRLVFA